MKTSTQMNHVRMNPYASRAPVPTSGDLTGASKLPTTVKVTKTK